MLDYDFVMFGMAVALLVSYGLSHGFKPWEKTVLALSWLIPGGARILTKSVGIPVGFLLLVVVFGYVIAHVETDKRAVSTA
jgi:hypothetical protein